MFVLQMMLAVFVYSHIMICFGESVKNTFNIKKDKTFCHISQKQ